MRGKHVATDRLQLSRGALCARRQRRVRAAGPATGHPRHESSEEEDAHHLLQETDFSAGGHF